MFLIADTETNGLPKDYRAPISNTNNWPRLVELAWQSLDENFQVISEKSFIIKPVDFKIPSQASDIHGITYEKAMEEGVLLENILEEFSPEIKKNQVLSGHNISFDYKIIACELFRKNLNDELNRLMELRQVCTMQSSTNICKIPGKFGKYKWPTLSEAYQFFFGKDFESAHRALNDVKASAEILQELKKRKALLLS